MFLYRYKLAEGYEVRKKWIKITHRIKEKLLTRKLCKEAWSGIQNGEIDQFSESVYEIILYLGGIIAKIIALKGIETAIINFCFMVNHPFFV